MSLLIDGKIMDIRADVTKTGTDYFVIFKSLNVNTNKCIKTLFKSINDILF